jgi:DNA-binding MarR family transcriptional regulator
MKEVNKLRELMQALEVFRTLDSDMPMAQATCLLIIAHNEGLSLKELSEKNGSSMAATSRYVAYFGKPHASLGHKTGLGLVVATEDPEERRKKAITLTAKGRALINKLGGTA